MTTNQLMECVLGKSCCFSGEYGDASPFTSSSIDVTEEICNKLQKYGFERHGWETLYNGMTGEPFAAKIFIGPTYYQRLKHIVSDKIHARARGNVTTLTKQPTSGRANDGGLRIGEKLPKWCSNTLLVCGVAGDTTKLRGLLVPICA